MKISLPIVILLLRLPTPTPAANLGAPISEPGLLGRSDIIYFQDFEGSAASWRADVRLSQDNFETSTAAVLAGARSLRVRFPGHQNDKSSPPGRANHYGGTIHFGFKENGLPEPEEVYFRYYLYVPSIDETYPFPHAAIWNPRAWMRKDLEYNPETFGEYRPGSVDKLPGFGGIYARQPWGGGGYGGTLSNGDNGWSARMSLKERDDGRWQMRYYVYHLGEDEAGIVSMWDWNAALSRQRWHCIEGYIRLNSIEHDPVTGRSKARADGILRGWIDGDLAFEKSDLIFRLSRRLKIEEIYGNFYIGGGWFPIQDCYLFTDNWVIASNPIGTFSETPSDSAP